MQRAIVSVIAGCWACASLAQGPAEDSGWYLGSGLVPLKPRLELGVPPGPADPLEAAEPSYRRFGGYRFTRNWSLDFGYAGGNRPAMGDGSIRSNAWTFSGTGLLPLTRSFSLLGRLGIAVPTAEFSLAAAASAEAPRYRMNMLWGFGGQYDFSPNVGLRMDYNSRYADDVGYSPARTDLWSINAVVRF